MATTNTILHKKCAVENKAPLSSTLEYGELAINYSDGNIYFKKTDNTIAEIKRLDERLNSTDVDNIAYNADGNLDVITYSTGNIVRLNYANDNLVSVHYYATNGTTHLYTQSIVYDVDDNIISTVWSAV